MINSPQYCLTIRIHPQPQLVVTAQHDRIVGQKRLSPFRERASRQNSDLLFRVRPNPSANQPFLNFELIVEAQSLQNKTDAFRGVQANLLGYNLQQSPEPCFSNCGS